MSYRKPLIHVLLFLSLVTGLRAADAPATPRPWPQDKSDLKPDSAAVFGTLPNGFRYAILPNKEPPGRLSLRLVVNAGSLMETDNERGLAHFLEHMAFNGSKHYSAGQMVEYFQRAGLAFGADTNANTGFDRTMYKLELPDTSDKLVRDSLQLLRDDCDGLLLAQDEVEKESGVVLSEKRDRDSVGYRTMVANWNFLFPEGLPAQRMPIGEESVIRAANHDSFASFWGKWYTPDRCTLVVVGDIKPDDFIPLIREYFGPIAAKPVQPDPDLGKYGTPGFLATLHYEPEAPDVSIELMTVSPFTLGADSKARRTFELTLDAANFMLSRRLERITRQPNAPISQGDAYSLSYFDAFQGSGVDVTCQPEQWNAALNVAEQQLRSAIEFGFTAAEVNEARAAILNRVQESVKEVPTRKSRALSDQLAEDLATNHVFTHPADDLAFAEPVLLALTPEKCSQVFRDAWNLSGRRLFVSGNLKLDDAAAALTAAYTKSASTTIAKPAESTDETFGYASAGEPGKVVERKEVADLGITQLRFANNVRVDLKRTDFEANKIRILVQFGGGDLDLPQSKPGLGFVADATFIEGGLGKHSAEDLDHLLAGKNVGADFSVDEDFFNLAAVTTPRDFRLQLELLKAYLTDPGYRPESLALAQRQFPAFFNRLATDVEGVFANELPKFVSGGDFRFGFPTQAQAEAVTLDDLRAWLTPALKDSYLEIAIVGDFDPAEAEAALAATFGTLPNRAEKRADYASALTVKFPAATEGTVKTISVPTAIPRAVALSIWPTCDMREDITRVRALGVLSEIFNDRLRVQVREQMGEVYSPDVANRSSEVYPKFGYMMAILPADPAQAAPLAEKARVIGGEIASGGVTEDEFNRAVEPMRKSLLEYRRQNPYWLARVLAGSQAFPNQLDWARTLSTAYDNITPAQVAALAKEYLDPAKAARLVIVPAAPATAPATAPNAVAP